MLHMMTKLGECAEQNWRKLPGFEYLAKVIDDVKIINGEVVGNPTSPPLDSDSLR